MAGQDARFCAGLLTLHETFGRQVKMTPIWLNDDKAEVSYSDQL